MNDSFDQQKQNEGETAQDTGTAQFENTAEAVENIGADVSKQEDTNASSSNMAVVIAIAVMVMAAAAFYLFWF